MARGSAGHRSEPDTLLAVIARRAGRRALYGQAREAAIGALPGPVAPGGTLLVIAPAAGEEDPVRDPAMMPWPLARSELEALAGSLTVRSVERFPDGEDPPELRWRAESGRS